MDTNRQRRLIRDLSHIDLDPDTHRHVDLPQALSTFVGRERELEAVVELLGTPHVRIVTMTGVGGVGKTRLSLQALSMLERVYPDGITYVPLAPVGDPALVPALVAGALGVPDDPRLPLAERLHAFLDGKMLLLVLDNVEHLPGVASFIADILAGARDFQVLCTSRSRLGISGEHLVPVAPLEPGDAHELFLQRGRAVEPQFVPGPSQAAVIDRICERLDNVPLAIELAAARVDVLPLRAILERLDHSLSFLVDGPLDAPVRQRTMRDTIAWSYDLLAPDVQRCLRRLATFPGGFSLDGASAVVGDTPDVLPAITMLHGSGLVRRKADFGNEPRYQMLETIRAFGLELLRAMGEDESTCRNLAAWMTELVEAQVRKCDGPELRIAHDLLEMELDNCRAALAWALDAGEASLAIRIAGGLWRNWWYGRVTGGRPWHDRVTEGRTWLDRALALRDGQPAFVLVDALAGAGHLARMQGDVATAEAWGEELLVRSRVEGCAYGIFWALHLLGWVAEAHRHDLKAQHLYEESISIAPRVRDPDNHAAMSLVRLSGIAERAGKLERAAAGFEEALVHYRACGNPAGIATAAFNLGRVMRKLGKSHQAAQLLHESAAGYERQRDLGGVHASLVELSLAALGTNQVTAAIRLLAQAETFPGHPDCRPAFDTALATATSLEAEPAFGDAWQAGQAMTWAETYADVGTLVASMAGDASPVTATEVAGLSLRELDVLRLVTVGHSNRTIADMLSISQRTVENHVQHILDKLGLDSRTAAAAWAVRNGLA